MAAIPAIADRVVPLCKNVDAGVVRSFISRLSDDYLERFDPATIAGHIQALNRLSKENPVEVLVKQEPDGQISVAVLAFDHPYEFSLITGMLASSGFAVESSDAYTLSRSKSSATPRSAARLRRGSERPRDPRTASLIVDQFYGRLLGPLTDFKKWLDSFEPALVQVLRLLDAGDEQSTEQAKGLVNERVTQWLKWRNQAEAEAAEEDTSGVTIERMPQFTRLRLHAPSKPAFLYSLSTALSLHGLQIERTVARTADGRTDDEVDVVDLHGRPVTEEKRLRQLRLSVLLTERFAYVLDAAPDPFTALRRFEVMSEKVAGAPNGDQWLAVLSNPRSMADLAKVLGASDHLWEDFIRMDADSMLPLLQQRAQGREIYPSASSLPRRLEEALEGTTRFDGLRRRLNEFKDRELFLIDLDHILAEGNSESSLQLLSERLGLLAETLVATAARSAHEELVRLYGKPRDSGGDVGFAIFGLGKLGGMALGYASDIELLFLYGGEGHTAGGARGSLGNDEFFAILTRETRDSIQARRQGIFQVDLRLRPFGTRGALAHSKEQFARYFGVDGQAHSFERLALVRLRWIAGDSRLGFEIEELRDRLVYEAAPLDLNAIWEVTGKMRAQHVKKGQVNSKYSAGGLADLESTVQMLQVMHGGTSRQVRTPIVNEAIVALHRAGVISAAEFEDIVAAYHFMRRLINAQRLLRGSALDLVLPARDSQELTHLARRMNYLPRERSEEAGVKLLEEFERRAKSVKQFVRKRLGRATPGER
jgi:glutamate-ammonia-ligase adenylyltransferase